MKYLQFARAGLLAASIAGLATAAGAFELKSSDLQAGKPIPEQFAFNGFGCTGQNISPSLTWTDPPSDTRSFAVMVHDPDAKSGGAGFWHWVVIDIPADVRSLRAGAGAQNTTSLPKGATQISTDFGSPGWGGPCPPKGDQPHRYVFTIYALKTDKLQLPSHPTASLAGFLINMNAIAKTQFISTYGH